MVDAPRIDALTLPRLADGSIESLRPSAVIEAMSFESVTFEGLDLTDAVFTECSLDRVSIVESQLRGIRVADSRVTGLNAPVLAAARSRWRDVTIASSRIGSAELFESEWRGARIENCKLGYLNLRGASLSDVLITDCTIDELDLGHATGLRLAITDCEIGTLDVTRAELSHADLRGSRLSFINGLEGLRGSTIDETQLLELSGHLAAAAGIAVEPR